MKRRGKQDIDGAPAGLSQPFAPVRSGWPQRRFLYYTGNNTNFADHARMRGRH
jgi:hypothetical protein